MTASRVATRLRILAVVDGHSNVDELPPSDREELLRAAEREGMGGLLRAPERPPSNAARLTTAVLMGHVTRRSIDLLEDAGVACAVLKGVVVGALAWEDPSRRPQWDVDVLVSRHELARAIDVLRRGGLIGEMKLEGRSWHHTVLRTLSPPGALFELHRELSVDLPVRVRVEELLDRRIRVPTPVGELPTLGHEDALVYLGLHAAVHALDRLSWLVDIAGYFRRQRVDLDGSVGRARAWGVTLAVDVAWRAANRFLNAGIPVDALRGLRVPWRRRALSEGLLAAADRSSGGARLALERCFRLSLLPGPLAVVRTLKRKLRARAEGRRAGAHEP